MMGVFLVILFIGLCIIAGISSYQGSEAHKNELTRQDEYIQENKLNITVEYNYDDLLHYHSTRFMLDEYNKIVYIYSNSPRIIEIPFYKIIGCDIMVDSRVAGGVGRAVAGAILAGEAGAIVGATTAKEYIMSFKIIIYCNDLSTPQITLMLINEKTKTKSQDYAKATEFANKINASIKAILYMNQNGENNPALADKGYNQPAKKVILAANQINKMTAIKYIKDLKGLSLIEAKECVENTAPVICENVTLEEAKSKVNELALMGLDARIVDYIAQ